MNLIRRLNESLMQKGLLETLKSGARILIDYSFDLRHGTDTMRKVEIESFKIASGNREHATRYQATKTRPLMKLFSELQLPKDGIFIDLGCGKGRVLFLAAQLGFRKVVGVEFCARLCRQARGNAELFLKKYPASSPIEVIEADVTSYEFKGDENVFFLYNPFDSVVLGQVLDNISKSELKAPRDLWLIYNNPVYHEMVQKHWLFPAYSVYEIEGELFHIYHHGVVK